MESFPKLESGKLILWLESFSRPSAFVSVFETPEFQQRLLVVATLALSNTYNCSRYSTITNTTTRFRSCRNIEHDWLYSYSWLKFRVNTTDLQNICETSKNVSGDIPKTFSRILKMWASGSSVTWSSLIWLEINKSEQIQNIDDNGE